MAALALPLTLSLGVWQLQRAEFKRELARAHAARQSAPPLSCAELVAEDTDVTFRRARLRGRFESGHDFLLDNRTYEGHVGYEVLTGFRCANGALVMLNRGWIVMPEQDRSRVPRWETPSQELTVFATVGAAPRIREQVFEGWGGPSPMRMLSFDAAQISGYLAERVFDRMLMLGAGQQGAFEVRFVEADFDSTKHTGYAVQWFAMALGVVGWFGFSAWNSGGRETQ